MNHTFVIEWVGPFNNIDSLKDWENKNNQTFEYKFYIVTGKLKGRRGITRYCGITTLKVRYNKIYPAQELSDVILYDECNGGVFGTKRLKQLIKID